MTELDTGAFGALGLLIAAVVAADRWCCTSSRSRSGSRPGRPGRMSG